MPELCWLDGEILPVADARIDPRDRGFLFGDGVYETVKVAGGRALHLEPHLERLAGGLERIRVPMPAGLVDGCREVLAAAGVESGSLYLQVTRGVAPRVHFPPAGMPPTGLILPMAHRHDPMGSRALSAATVPDWRWTRCDIKTTSLMATVLAKLAARDAGADEALLVSGIDAPGAAGGGEIREGGSSNFFARRDGALETHPLDGRILPGVTRAILVRLAAEEGIPVRERAPRLAERGEWEEAFLCGTLTGVQPLVALDGEPVGGGLGGEWTARLAGAFARYEERLLATV